MAERRNNKRPYCCDDDAQNPTASGLESPSLSDSVQQHSFLKDVNGDPRGVYVTLAEGEEQEVLIMLRHAYSQAEKNLGKVQRYTENLLHCSLQSPGFPVAVGSSGREFFSEFPPSHVSTMEDLITMKLQNALKEIGYCAEDQTLQLYLSFLKTIETDVQPPHIDYHFENICPEQFRKRPRSFKNNYKEWVPFVALFPLTTDGMTVEVWCARRKHNVPECEEDQTGNLIHIPFGTILLLRADVVHAGGFATSESGNPRGHFYIYKTPRGLQHPYPLSNCYEVKIDGVRVPLLEHYKHCSECEQANSVKYVRSPYANKKSKH